MTDKIHQFGEPKRVSIFDIAMGESRTGSFEKTTGEVEGKPIMSYFATITETMSYPRCVTMRHRIQDKLEMFVIEKGQSICPSQILPFGKALYFVSPKNKFLFTMVLNDYTPGSIVMLTGEYGPLSDREIKLIEKYDAVVYHDSDKFYQKKYSVVGISAKIVVPFVCRNPVIIPLETPGS